MSCVFPVWSKEQKSFVECGESCFITIEDAEYCREHYVDAVMHLQSSDKSFSIITFEKLPDTMS